MKQVVNVIVALMLAWGTAATAAVIYSNGPTATNSFVSDPDFPTFVSDDFTLAAGANVITGVQWKGLYAFTNTPQPVDIFTIQIFADIGGAPAVNPLHSLPVGNPGRTDTGINLGNFDLFAYSVDVAPIALAPGTPFWLSIFNDTTGDANDNWFWGMQDAVGNSFERPDQNVAWIARANRQDFQLSGPLAVSEPSVLALLAIGVIGLLGFRRKQVK